MLRPYNRKLYNRGMENRCDWAQKNEILQRYHDQEWGVPLHDDRRLFEFLILDCFQAGLSWQIILKKREALRIAFDNFEPAIVGGYDEAKILEITQNPEIIRNKQKIRATVANALGFVKIQEEFGSFDRYIWQYVKHTPVVNRWEKEEDIPAVDEISKALSQDLKKRGFAFVGPTIVYAYMQSIGMVNDHLVGCFRYKELVGNNK
jgi:DNA-3-methyladenine glycosylase I